MTKMNNRRLNAIACFVALVLLAPQAQAQEPKAPENAAIDWEYEIAYQRGLEAVVWAVPAVSMVNFREAYFALGGGFNTVYWLSKPPTALQEALTANNQTPYAVIVLTTKDGPVVLDVPPATERTAIFGSAVDIWQEPVADIGPAGEDQGKGGRYLFLPPGYEEDVPGSFIVVPMETYNIIVALRNIPLGDATFAEAAEYSKQINAYPLNQADNPPPGDYIDQAAKHLPTLTEFDLSYFKDVATVIDEERLLERDKVMGGLLASIGIEKGIPFEPKGKVKQALEQAVIDGRAYLEHMFETPGYSLEVYWPGRQWLSIKEPSKDGFVYDEGDYLLLDERGSAFFWATFIPRRLGKASAYVVGQRDADGELLSGNKQYKLTVPANVPVRDFWSVIAYGKDTKAFIYNQQDIVGLSSYDKPNMQVNADGSVDVYFGEAPPRGLESNWIPTAGEDFFLLFRFYGPEQAFFDKTFKLPDIKKAR